MTNSKMTRKALFTSIMALILCFAMLTGTTFAWFTDQETSGNNKIIAGNLDVELTHTNKNVTDKAIDGETELFQAVLPEKWEPGAMAVEVFTVKNAGNLAFKYEFSMNVVSATLGKDGATSFAKMLKVAVVEGKDAVSLTDRLDPTNAMFEWKDLASFTQKGNLYPTDYPETGTDYPRESVYTVVVWWEPSDMDNNFNMNNELKGKKMTADFNIQLIATQLMAEEDAFDNKYDEPSIFPGNSPESSLGDGAIVLTTTGDNVSTVTLAAELVSALPAGVTDVSIDAALPNVNVDGNNVSVVYGSFEIVDQEGNAIDLTDNTVTIPVKLYVGVDYAGKYATVSHDGVNVANAVVDAEGYVSYNTTHFCAISIVLADEEPADGMDDVKDETVEDLTKLVEVRVGNHYYTVSQGMANSWYEYPTVPGKIEADIYVPEDLIAFAMMYKNGDLKDTGSHSDLTLVNDLDYTGYNWIPIGRFYTNIHGEGHKVSNLNNSFFGCVYDCQLDNITIENVNASGSAAGVLGKELAGDIYFTDVTIAGTNTVTYVKDNATNWPEGGTGVGAICGVSLIGCGGHGELDVTVAGTITVNYNDVVFGNTTNLENLGVSKEFGLNVYKENAGATVTVAEGGSIATIGVGHLYNVKVAEGFMQDSLNDGKYYAVYNAEGLKYLSSYVNNGNDMNGCTVTLFDDIDLNNEDWTPIGSGDVDGKWIGFNGSFDGQNHTVSNFKVTKSGGWNGLFGLIGRGTSGYTEVVSNLTVENVVIENTNRMSGAIVGQMYGNIENCHVKNVTISAIPNETANGFDNGDKIGGITGWLGDNGNNHYIKECTATDVTLKAYRDVGGITGYIGSSTGVENCAVDTVSITVDQVTNHYGDKETNAGAVVGRIYKQPVTIENNTEKNIEISKLINGAGALVGGINTNETVVLGDNIENAPVTTTAPYGNYYGVAQNGGVLDGNGKTLDFDMGENKGGKYDNYGVMTAGGTIKNATVTGVFRGIMIMNPTEDVCLDNVIIGDEDVCYALNTGEGDGTHDLIATNCTFKGWTSIGTAVKSVSFTNCTFAQGSYYTDVYGRLVKPYVDTVFDGCEFNSKFYIDLSQLGKDGDGNVLTPDTKITLKNCTVNGVKLTADNWKDLIVSESDCGDGQISIEAKDGSYMSATNVLDYVVIE